MTSHEIILTLAPFGAWLLCCFGWQVYLHIRSQPAQIIRAKRRAA